MNQTTKSPIIVDAIRDDFPTIAKGLKYVAGARIPIFGHAAHSSFQCDSREFVNVPGTFSSETSNGQGRYRLEVAFATNHDKGFSLRMFDPANPSLDPQWSFDFWGGHASNIWWNFQTTPTFNVRFKSDPWPRQSTLQARSIDGSTFFLGSVVLVVESFVDE